MDIIYPPEAEAFRTRVKAFLVEQLPVGWGGIGAFVDRARGARTGVVRHHAPALRSLVIDVGGQHESVTWPFGGEHLYALQHAVHTSTQ